MKITYTGHTSFSPAQQKKLDAKFAKLAKLLDRGGEREAHVILTQQRQNRRAEITVRYYDHALVGVGINSETQISIHEAVEKIEKQILRLREKWRDTKRTPEAKAKLNADVPPPAPKVAAKPKMKPKNGKADGAAKQVFKVNHKSQRKPMTVEEAMLEIDNQSGYMVYRDADSDRVHVLVKRSDGHFDLIES